LNPIEQACPKSKKFLRDARVGTQESLDQAATDALKTITAGKAVAWFRHCGYQGTAIVASL
jgi:hypothetical protein